MEYTIKNYTRKRRWGWGWSVEPSKDCPLSVKAPSKPDYTGTLGQLKRAIQDDVAFQYLGGTFYCTSWFWDGKRITHTWGLGRTADGEWDYCWMEGFWPEEAMVLGNTLKIRTED